MIFMTAADVPRPVRLDEATRQFAARSLAGQYGDETCRTPAVTLDDIDGIESMDAQQRYDAAVLRIAQQAPLRICPEETVSGAATLGLAIGHAVPATFGGCPAAWGLSHLTLDFPSVLQIGIDGLEEQVDRRLAQPTDEGQRAVLRGMKNAVRAMHIWQERYVAALADVLPENAERMRRVPFLPPRDFREAVQSLWSTFAFARLTGIWPGIGRIDQMLGPYLRRDLADGRITIDEARRFLAGLFVKGCEWIRSDTPPGSGDAQHYQNLVLAGVDEDGDEVTNEVTYLVLDIVEELPIGDFPIAVRVNAHTPQRLLLRMAEVIRHGGGVLAVYGEDTVLDTLSYQGYPLRVARQFANDGCWEVQIPGMTYFYYDTFDALQLLQREVLHLDTDTPAVFASFEELYARYRQVLTGCVAALCRKAREKRDVDAQGRPDPVNSVASLLERGCIDSATDYFQGGARYRMVSQHIGGAPDVGNCLYAIDRLVFCEKKVGFAELMHLLKTDWAGGEILRRYAQDRLTYYGNDDDTADAYTVRVLTDFAAAVQAEDAAGGPIRFTAGISTFGRQVGWAHGRCATPAGAHAGQILSGNASPTPGTDKAGATAVIRSYAKLPHRALTGGSALDLKLYPATVWGDDGREALAALIRGFVALGGSFLQLDVLDAAVLRRAQEHPEDYKTLSVRVSGWNARFITLDREWQEMIIERTAQGLS